jgi:hypothetical protein
VHNNFAGGDRFRLKKATSVARFPLERNPSSEEKSRQIKLLERILIAKV